MNVIFDRLQCWAQVVVAGHKLENEVTGLFEYYKTINIPGVEMESVALVIK